MDYQMMPMGEVWSEGMFSVPSVIVSKYIRLASAYQLKALLVILSNGGRCSSKDVAKATGVPESELCDILSFWVEEGVLVEAGGEAPAPVQKKPAPVIEKKEPEKVTKTVEAMPVPTLSPQEVTAALRESEELTSLMQEAEVLKGKLLSHVEKQLVINMVNYYGLPGEVVLTILQYYKTEKENGRVNGTSYIAAMAKNWCEEGITTLAAADEKLRELEESDRNWDRIIEMSGIRYRKPTPKQREMVKSWRADFSDEMLALACDIMKENAERPTLKYVDSILKSWRKNEITTPDDVARENEKHQAEKDAKNGARPEIEATYDLDKISKDTMFNDDFDI